MLARNLIAMLQADRPVYIHIEGHGPLEVEAVELRVVEKFGETVLGWCIDPTHPMGVVVNALKAKGQEVSYLTPRRDTDPLERGTTF